MDISLLERTFEGRGRASTQPAGLFVARTYRKTSWHKRQSHAESVTSAILNMTCDHQNRASVEHRTGRFRPIEH